MTNITAEKLMQQGSSSLPQGCVIRPAKAQEKWLVQQLVWEFTKAEGIELDIRIFGYHVLILGGLILCLAAQIWIIRGFIYLPIVKIGLVFTGLINLFFIILRAHFLIIQLIERLIGAAFSWSKFWVVEYEHTLIGCALLNHYVTSSELACVFIKPAWQGQGIGSALVQRLMQAAPKTIYLACKPRMVQFYTNLGWQEIPWRQLSADIKSNFGLFRPHLKLWGFPLIIFQYEANPIKENLLENVESLMSLARGLGVQKSIQLFYQPFLLWLAQH
ncbi:MAG: GNAT family N-acetyltransferase [Cyanothece sp. SIO1E1]|nr:GNAT family N-acetyltransferase [Cyanothece sp. SIO1E1]